MPKREKKKKKKNSTRDTGLLACESYQRIPSFSERGLELEELGSKRYCVWVLSLVLVLV